MPLRSDPTAVRLRQLERQAVGYEDDPPAAARAERYWCGSCVPEGSGSRDRRVRRARARETAATCAGCGSVLMHEEAID